MDKKQREMGATREEVRAWVRRHATTAVDEADSFFEGIDNWVSENEHLFGVGTYSDFGASLEVGGFTFEIENRWDAQGFLWVS